MRFSVSFSAFAGLAYLLWEDESLRVLHMVLLEIMLDRHNGVARLGQNTRYTFSVLLLHRSALRNFCNLG